MDYRFINKSIHAQITSERKPNEIQKTTVRYRLSRQTAILQQKEIPHMLLGDEMKIRQFYGFATGPDAITDGIRWTADKSTVYNSTQSNGSESQQLTTPLHYSSPVKYIGSSKGWMVSTVLHRALYCARCVLESIRNMEVRKAYGVDDSKTFVGIEVLQQMKNGIGTSSVSMEWWRYVLYVKAAVGEATKRTKAFSLGFQPKIAALFVAKTSGHAVNVLSNNTLSLQSYSSDIITAPLIVTSSCTIIRITPIEFPIFNLQSSLLLFFSFSIIQPTFVCSWCRKLRWGK